MKRFAAVLLTVGALAGLAWADAIVLKDGTRLEGTVKQVDAGFEVKLADGSIRIVQTDDVKALVMTADEQISDDVARERLESLRRSVENDSNLKRIVDRYKKFILTTEKTKAADLARKDLATWQARLTENRIKVGKRWLDPKERKQLYDDQLLAINAVRSLVGDNQWDQAQKVVREQLELDPDNISFHYFNGVMALRRKNIPEAKRAFDAVQAVAPEHVPTLANQVIIAVETKRWPIVISTMDKALTLAPGVQALTDNAAELLQLVPDNVKRQPAYERLERKFQDQDLIVQADQATKGLFRFGSSWLTQEQLTKAKAEREAFEAEKTRLQTEYDSAESTVKQNEQRIAANNDTMRQIEADSVYFDPVTNRQVRRALPDTYWQLQRENEKLKLDNVELAKKMDKLRVDAKTLLAKEPHPPYKGSMVPIGVDGVPVMEFVETPVVQIPTTAPTTKPSTQPAR
jgi:tetratricopeptide (TPR) repeat protein